MPLAMDIAEARRRLRPNFPRVDICAPSLKPTTLPMQPVTFDHESGRQRSSSGSPHARAYCLWRGPAQPGRRGGHDTPMAAARDYSIATLDTGQGPFRWRWELRRHSSPMGVRIGSGGYQSQAAAEIAGKRALED